MLSEERKKLEVKRRYIEVLKQMYADEEIDFDRFEEELRTIADQIVAVDIEEIIDEQNNSNNTFTTTL